MKYILQLQDSVKNSRNDPGRFDNKPLFFSEIIQGAGFFEFVRSLAMNFDSFEAARWMAAKEHARCPFAKTDRLTIIDEGGNETALQWEDLESLHDQVMIELKAEKEARNNEEEDSVSISKLKDRIEREGLRISPEELVGKVSPATELVDAGVVPAPEDTSV